VGGKIHDFCGGFISFNRQIEVEICDGQIGKTAQK